MARVYRWGNTSVVAGVGLALLIGFNNCSGHFASNDIFTAPASVRSDSASIQSIAPRGVNLADVPISNLSAHTEIDALPYFSSHLLPPNKALGSFFKISAVINDYAVLTHTKFNQKDNIEVFIATPSEITLRYESSPLIYGNVRDSIRRFKGLPMPAADLNGAALGPNSGDVGSHWTPRVLTKAGTNRPSAAAAAIDHYVFSSRNVAGALTLPFAKSFNWYEFISTEFQFPFVRDQSNTVLRLTQQWSTCNIEQYEYVIGLGLVAWRAFHSAKPGCEKRAFNRDNIEVVTPVDTSEQTRIVVKNYFSGLPVETFYRTDGNRFGEYSLEVFENLPVSTYSPEGLFLDDFPYFHTAPLLTYTSVLRSPAATAPMTEVIRRAYLDFLGRRGTPAEIAGWESKIRAGALNLPQTLVEIQNSFEARLRSIYQKHLQKELDPAGTEFWYRLYNDGYSFEQITRYVRSERDCKFQCL